MMGKGLTYQARQKLRFQCPDCGADLAAGLIEVHKKMQPVVGMGVRAGDQWETSPPSRITTDVLDLIFKCAGDVGIPSRGV